MQTEQQNIPESENNAEKVMLRPDIPTLFIDNFIMHKMRNGNMIFSGVQSIPTLNMEQVRFMITTDHAARMADKIKELLCMDTTSPTIPEPILKNEKPQKKHRSVKDKK